MMRIKQQKLFLLIFFTFIFFYGVIFQYTLSNKLIDIFNFYNSETKLNYINFTKDQVKYLNSFKYSKNVSKESLILIDLQLVEKEVSLNTFSHFIYGYGYARCISNYENNNTTILVLYDKKRNLYIGGNVRSMIGKCPWGWAKKCEWNSFQVIFFIPNNLVKYLQNVTIFNLYTSSKLDVTIKKTYNTKKNMDNLTICVPPLYWYNNFLQLFIFTEIWKIHGASHFIYYYYSASEDVMNLLKYYESKKIATLIPFKSLPKSNFIDPNKSVYRYGHISAINDCLKKRFSKYSIVIDVDEFLYLNKTSLSIEKTFYQYIEEVFENDQNIGGILFSHFGLQIDINNLRDDFNFLQNTYLYPFKGPNKYIIKPNRIQTVNSHVPTKFMNSHYGFTKVNFKYAYLLHLRANWAYKSIKTQNIISLITSNQTNQISNEFLNIRKVLKFSKELNFQTNALKIMNSCLKNWKMNGCKVPNDLCQKDLLGIEKWIKSDDIPTSDNYLIL
uniref:Glycosyltransferase family 92 protein n=1 Tax=Strongyloides stercoralis TaxID=6248 RepID=A0A0K0EJR7_STRER